METDKLFFIHRRPDLFAGGDFITGGMYAGGDFKKTIEFLNNDTLDEKDIRLFIGYCGWDSGELEAEIEEGSWIEVIADAFEDVAWVDFIEKLP